jgi:hypothetical protein
MVTMNKKPDTIVSGALHSNPKQNAKDAERLFNSDEGDEAEQANKAMRKQQNSGDDQDPILKGSVEERFGSPD